MTESVTLDYWLPTSVVTITGSMITHTNTADGDPKTSVERPTPVVVIAVEPDRAVLCRLSLPASVFADQKVKLTRTSDGRLAGIDASYTDKRNEVALNVLKAAAPLVALASGGIPALIAAGTITAAASARTTLAAGAGQPEIAAADVHAAAPEHVDEMLQALHIKRKYYDERPAEVALLINFRGSLLNLERAMAEVASDVLSGKAEDKLERLHKASKTVRAGSVNAEARYQIWLDSKVTTETVPYEAWFKAEDLLTAAEATEWLADHSWDEDGDWFDRFTHTGGRERFAGLVRQMRVIVTLDVDNQDVPNPDHRADHDARPFELGAATQQIYYREPQVGVLNAYAVEGKDGKSRLRLLSTRRTKVILPKSERAIAVQTGHRDRSITIGFDADGVLTSLQSDQTSSLAATTKDLASIPDILKTGMTTGGDLIAPWTAKGRADEFTQQKALKDALAALNPAPAPADPDKKLKADLATAELKARLRAAERIQANPGSAVVILTPDS